jgi:hypothetical protein
MTATPKRSTGVTLTAVVCLIGSAFFLLASYFSQFVLLMHRARPELTPRLSSLSWTAVPILRALGAWGIITAVGLLRRRDWARWSAILFSANTVAASAMAVVVIVSISTPAVASGKLVTVFFVVALAGIAASWLWYLNAAAARVQFEAGPGAPGGGPMSVWFIAWFLMIHGVTCMFETASPVPVVVLIVPIGGWAARAVWLAFAAADSSVGFALLRRKRLGNTLAAARCVFGTMSSLLFAYLPGYPERLRIIRTLMEHPKASLAAMQPTVVAEAAGWFIALCFLLARREAFPTKLASEQIPSQQAL